MTTHSKTQHPDISALDQELQQTVAQVLQQAENHYKSGQIQAAEELYRAILEIQPDHPEANYSLGVLSVESQQPRAALPYFRTAVTANPEYEQYWVSYVDALIQAEQMDEAYQVLELGRRHGIQGAVVEELAGCLLAHQQATQTTSATRQETTTHSTSALPKEETSSSKILPAKAERGPSRQDIKKLTKLQQKGQAGAIESFARDLIAHYPNHGLGWKTLGNILYSQGLIDEALQAMQKAANLLPEDSGVHNDLGVYMYHRGHLAEAEFHYGRAIEIKADFTTAMGNLGNLLKDQRRFVESEENFRRAIKLKADKVLYNNFGNTLLEAGRIIEAEAYYRRAIRIDPRHALSHLNLGVCLRKQGRLTEAVRQQRQAMKLNPQNTEQYTNLLFTLNYTTDTASSLFKEAEQFGQLVRKKVDVPFSSWRCPPRPERLRVGLVSGDLHNHPVGFFLEGILGSLNSDRVELIAYPTNPKADNLTARIKNHFKAWKPLFGMGDKAAAEMIHADGVHILLDLSGHTSHNRLPMFAWRPAPIQASWLGYFATTGVAEIDYFLTDEVSVPESQRDNFTEALWYLPDTRLCFTAPSPDVPISPLPALKNGYITIGCFQLLTKVGDEVLQVWSDILKALPDARLRWQCPQFDDPLVVKQLFERLARYGIDTERVTVHGVMHREGYLAAHAEVDLILDTFPFPGGTTTCEALWMGVPTLTLAGDSLLSRQGASLLTAAGLSDWVTTSKTDYIEKAIAMGSDLDMLADLRNTLRAQVLSSPLFDTRRFARNFEEALWGMWQEKQPQEGLLTPIDQSTTEKETISAGQPGASLTMIEIVSATRMTQSDFWNKSPLGLSLKRLTPDARLTSYIAYENQRGLPEVFNERITAQTGHAILVFVHDDVWIDDYFLADRVVEGLKSYDVIGVAGNRRRAQAQPAWAFIDEKLTWDDKFNLSGSVAHGSQPFGAISFFGAVPADCELLDGVFLAAKKNTLVNNGDLFDPSFDFHFYDMDFCRSARKRGLRLGTWPICLTHQSGGAFNSPNWRDKLLLYRKKWEV